jgi:pimeloyl-ACP methyl ester carboxylesterase
MSVRRSALAAATGAAGLAVAGAAVAIARQRRVIARRPDSETDFGSLRARPTTVVADDGVPLHVEVDEADSDVTVVLAHGYALNLDCWHFQRALLRERGVRTVLYDQRSHGRSGRSTPGHATIDHLGHDLKQVLDDAVPEGPVVVVGHSMGGMTIVALAEQHPELFGDRIVGVGLMSTTAGGLDPSRILFPMVPPSIGGGVAHRTVATLARGHRSVDRLRRLGRSVAMVATDLFAFGEEVPPSYVTFVDDMLSSTPFEVVAEFFPSFRGLDKFDTVEVLSRVPTTILCGTHDRLTSIGHSRKLHARIAGSRLVEYAGAGHMIGLERRDEVNQELGRLLDAATRGKRSA